MMLNTARSNVSRLRLESHTSFRFSQEQFVLPQTFNCIKTFNIQGNYSCIQYHICICFYEQRTVRSSINVYFIFPSRIVCLFFLWHTIRKREFQPQTVWRQERSNSAGSRLSATSNNVIYLFNILLFYFNIFIVDWPRR